MFYLDPENSISYALDGEGESFDSELGLLAVAGKRDWSKADVTAIWNGFAGTAGPFADLKPVKMFRNRPYGVAAIWRAIQRLTPAGAATDPAAPVQAIVEEEKPVKKTKKKATAKKAAVVKAKAPQPKKEGSKREEVIRLMSRKNGASGAEIQEAMGWLPHTTRGLISTLKSKGGLAITSEKHETRGRVYRIAS